MSSAFIARHLHSLARTKVATGETLLGNLRKARHIRKKCVPMPSIGNLLSVVQLNFTVNISLFENPPKAVR